MLKMIKWFKNLFLPKSEKVANAIQDEVLEACMAYGRERLDYHELRVYHNSLVRQINIGGINLKTAVDQAMVEALEGAVDDVETD